MKFTFSKLCNSIWIFPGCASSGGQSGTWVVVCLSIQFSKSLVCSIGAPHAHLEGKPGSSWTTVCANFLHQLPPLYSVIPGAFYGFVIRKLEHYLFYSLMSSSYYAPVWGPVAGEKGVKERQRETDTEWQREKGCFFLHILLWPVILIRSEGSPATLIVLGAYGSPMLPLLLTRNLIPTPGGWMRIFFWSSCLCPRPRLSFWLGDTRGKKKRFTYHPSFRATSNSSILLLSVCFCLFWVLKELLHYLSRFYGYIKHSDSILPRTSTYGHFVLIHVPMHLALHLQNYKCVYFHVSSFCKFSGEENILSNDLLDITLQNKTIYFQKNCWKKLEAHT